MWWEAPFFETKKGLGEALLRPRRHEHPASELYHSLQIVPPPFGLVS